MRWNGWVRLGPRRWRRPHRCRISACTCAPGNTTSPAIFGLEALSRVRGFSPVGNGAAQPPGHRLRIRQDPQGLRLPVGPRAGAHGRAARERPRAGTQAPAAPARVPQFPRRGGRHHRHHQDPGQRHQAGRADAALLRGQGAFPLGTRRQAGPAAGDADRRRRERRRDDERVPVEVSWRSCASAPARTRRP